ncbi:hypothetical protein [Streptomyces sp. NPDC088847]|uniref:hypothetical protein n=1 Tax=Streptomyces sp. NPDC088847 TaxID=3365909 RepID=UPI0037F7B6B8
MQLLVTSMSQETLDVWQLVIPPGDTVAYRKGNPRSVPSDAVCMSGIYAFERYGGRPQSDRGQILDNLRNDGLPTLIVVPPSRPLQRTVDGAVEVVPEFRSTSPAEYSMTHAVEAVKRWNERAHSVRIETLDVDLPLLGMDDPSDASTPRSVRNALIAAGILAAEGGES